MPADPAPVGSRSFGERCVTPRGKIEQIHRDDIHFISFQAFSEMEKAAVRRKQMSDEMDEVTIQTNLSLSPSSFKHTHTRTHIHNTHAELSLLLSFSFS